MFINPLNIYGNWRFKRLEKSLVENGFCTNDEALIFWGEITGNLIPVDTLSGLTIRSDIYLSKARNIFILVKGGVAPGMGFIITGVFELSKAPKTELRLLSRINLEVYTTKKKSFQIYSKLKTDACLALGQSDN